MNWGGAISVDGFVDITKYDGLSRDLHTECYFNLIEHEKDYRPVFQYFQLHSGDS